MPWKLEDVDKHKSGLSTGAKRVWLRVANTALARCTADGGDDCDASAIKQANAVAGKVSESQMLSQMLDVLQPLEEASSLSRKKRREEALNQMVTQLRTIIADFKDENDGDDGGSDEDVASTKEALGWTLDLTLEELSEAELSHDEKRSTVRDAIKKRFFPSNEAWCFVVEMYDTYAIFELSPRYGMGQPALYKVDYTIGSTGGTTLGTEAVKVARRTEYAEVAPRAIVTASESSQGASESGLDELEFDLVPLAEKAVRADGLVNLRLIQAGWGSSGHYSKTVLQRDGPKVFPKGTHMYVDHPTAQEERERPERSVEKIGGVLESDAKWLDNGVDGPGLYATAKPLGAMVGVIDDLAPHIGVSIRALGRAKDGEAEGRKGKIIESLVQGRSVDWVTKAGAGGKVLTLAESAREARSSPLANGASDPPNKDAPGGKESIGMSDNDEAIRTMQQAIDRLEEANKALHTENAENRRDKVEAQAKDLVRSEAARYNLPNEGRDRVIDHVTARISVTEADGAYTYNRDELVEAVKTRSGVEAAYITTINGGRSGRITGLGQTSAEAAQAEKGKTAERLEEALGRLGVSKDNATRGLAILAE